MEKIVKLIILFSAFGASFYSLSALRLEHFFRKNSTIQIQLLYIFASMALAYLVTEFLYSLVLR